MAYAQVKVKCTKCGEEFEWRKKCFNRSEADEAEKWAIDAGLICPECFKKEKAAERQAEKEKKKAKVDNYLTTFDVTLPDLNGSPRQVDWAMSIREEAIYGISSFLIKRLDPKNPDHKRLAQLMVTAISDAKVWIDNRERLDAVEYGREMYEELVKIINENVKVPDKN